MTYGALRLEIRKLCPGVDLEIIDGWIQDAYTELLDLLPWKRQEAESVLQSPATYNIGTVAGTQGSTTVVGVGTTWTSGMNGFMLRIDNQGEYYQVTFVDATHITLDRGYEGPTASGLAYRIDQNVFLLPPSTRIVRAVRPLHDRLKDLELVSPAELNRISTTRNTYGTPQWAAQTWDSFSDPPQLQLELYPVPDCPDSSGRLLSWSVDYIFDQAAIDPTATSTGLLPFVRPAALKAYCQQHAAALAKEWEGVEFYGAEFTKLGGSMAQINALQRGPQKLRLAPELRRQVPPRYRKGPRHVGWPG